MDIRHCDPKVASSRAKIDQSFPNNFSKTKSKTSTFKLYRSTATKQHKRVACAIKTKAQGVATLQSLPSIEN